MVPIRKKNGDIRICIDFRNLNKASLKDNFPLPTMEQILQSVAGSELMSFLDGFSGYNQILVHPDDQLKTTFITKWGTYAYQKMPFRLINAGATFQRAMDIAFKGLINKIVVVYLDDITVFSKERSNHLHDLNQIFQRCKKYGISLNPKKSFFTLDQGKLLGFIVSKDGIYIDPDKIKEISEIPFPHNKKSMQSFLGQINFVKRFVPDFSQIILPLQTMIKKNSVFKWGSPEKEAFELIKQSIINALALNTPNFSNNFTLYTIASDCSYAAVLTQINDHNLEAPISFYSSNLQGAELNYSEEAQRVLQELHDRPAGGHFAADTTAHKVIHAGYYWPNLFRDAHEYHKYILTATDYFTKWVEAILLKTTNSEAIIEFIDQFIITRFGVPNALVFDNASYFSGNAMFDFTIKRGFKLKYSTNYYPQGNGLAKSTNKNLIKIIKRTIEQNHKNWHKSLIFALWADKITQKASIGSSPFKLVYGKEVVLPTNLILPSLALVQFIEESPSSSLQLRHDQILKLEEEREKAKIIHAKHQQIIKSSFDSISSGSKQFQVGDLVLKWDKAHEDKGKHTKFRNMWLGPFQICEKIGHSTFMLQDLSGLRDSLPVNGLILKKFFN
eukprot:PITA_29494